MVMDASEHDRGRTNRLPATVKRHAVAEEAEAEPIVIAYKRRRGANHSPDTGLPCLNMVTSKHHSEQHRHGAVGSHWSSWKDTLEGLLQSPRISEGGGIQSTICDALRYNSSQSTQQGDIGKGRGAARKQSGVVDIKETDTSVAIGNGTAPSLDANRTICNNVLADVLVSEKFALLCDLLVKTFHSHKSERIIGFEKIDAKMKNGDYARSPGLFDHDIHQIWEKFEEVGHEMMDLASSLSIISRASYQKQVCGVSEIEVAEHKTGGEKSLVAVAREVPKDSTTTMQMTPCNSGHSIKPKQTEVSGMYGICTCMHCGTKANSGRSLTCDGCEAMYDLSCVKPAFEEIPAQSWYCSACNIKRKDSDADIANSVHHDSSHDNCVVCDRLDLIRSVENLDLGGKTELGGDVQGSPFSSMGEDKKPNLSTTALSRLCKHCGTCEDDDRKFLICGHEYCPYKFYHIRCLKTRQIASAYQRNRTRWYCPSCLCRGCFVDKDDDQIILCDGCDEAYHIYCMKPPRTSIPKGQWYCLSCNIGRAREGMRKYEQSILRRQVIVKCVSDANQSVDGFAR